MMKPIVLVSAGQENTKKGILQYHVYENYAAAIVRAGGIPVLMCNSDKEYLRELSCLCDGLFLTGGEDIEPSLYGQKNGGLSGTVDAVRDKAEMELCRLFAETGKPTIGICRGLQILNVFFGGTLTQDLAHDRGIEHRYHADHALMTEEYNWLRKTFGHCLIVNSYHHQAIDVLGKGLRATAFSADGQVVEAVEHEILPIFAVQWHPERMTGTSRYDVEGPDMAPFFERFIQNCKERSK